MPYIHEGPPLYLTADRETVVEEGDPRAAFLLVNTGGAITDHEARHYKLVKTEAPNKAKAAPDNKAK